jgi:hypothetical protein
MLPAAHPDWSEEQIDQELFARIEVERLLVYFNLMRDTVNWADAHEVERKLGHTPQWLVDARAALARAGAGSASGRPYPARRASVGGGSSVCGSRSP